MTNMCIMTLTLTLPRQPLQYLFNIFIIQVLLDLNNCDTGIRIGDTLYNSTAYADDITLFSTNVQDLQNLIMYVLHTV